MRILILDAGSNCLDWAMRCKNFGHEVKWWDKPRPNGTCRRAGEGIIDKITDFQEIQRKWLHWADLIYLPDNAHYLDMLEPYRKLGYPIYMGSAEAAQLELDRAVGQEAMKKAGIPIMSSVEFKDYDAAIKFVQKNPEFLVSKPSGDANKALSYVAHDAADLTFMLERWSKREDLVKAAKTEGFILQEKKKGAEMAVGGFFGPGGWSQYFIENYENKKLMDGDLGVATGEMGTLVQVVKESKLADKVLLPITKKLEELGYVGYIDNNCIIDLETGEPWPMEWTMRDGWPLRHNLTALIKNEDPAQWMLDMINGEDTLEMSEGEICISVVMAIPDFPYSKLTNKEVTGIPIYGDIDPDHIHLSEVMLGEAPIMAGDKVIRLPMPVTCGDYVLVATGCGETITGARRSAYSAIKKIRMPNSPFYRLDIGKGRMVKQLPGLKSLGYSKNLEF